MVDIINVYSLEKRTHRTKKGAQLNVFSILYISTILEWSII